MRASSRTRWEFSLTSRSSIKVTEPDILLALSQEAADLFIPKVKKSGVILLDPAHVKDVSQTEASVFSLPFTEEAVALGRANVANVIALGTIAAMTLILSKTSLENTLSKRFGSSQRELNLKAVSKGYELAAKQQEEAH